jgi:hypothetical protein
MPTLIEEMMGLLEIFYVIVFNPITWLVVASFAFKRKPLWQLMLFGTLAQFCTMIGISQYYGTTVSLAFNLFNYEWLILMVPISIGAGVVVGALVFYLFKLRKEHKQPVV